LNDITSGNNDITGQIGGYQAGPGWDACTGWGSPRGTVLAQVLAGGGSGSGGATGSGPGASGSSVKKKHKRPQRGGKKSSGKKSSKKRAGKKRSGRG
jgi:hypothetical protein